MSAVFVPQPTRIDVTRYHRMIEAAIFRENERIELIEGVLLDMPPIYGPHVSAVNRLTRLLINAIPEHDGEIMVQGPVILGDLSQPQPDLVVLKPQADRDWRVVPTSADVLLLIEVADSSLRYDRQVKLPLYARFGVAEYWIVNLQDAQLEMYREPGPRGYGSVLRVDRGSLASPAHFPDLRIDWGSAIG